MIVDEPRYVPNTVIRRDLQIPTVKDEIICYKSQYGARLSTHPNEVTVNLVEPPDNRLLRRNLKLILSVTVVFVMLVFNVYFLKSHSRKPHVALNLLITEECY
jgi:hypothetical protein